MDKISIINAAAADDTNPKEHAARALCLFLCVDPWDCVRPGEARFSGYEGDFYMNWARDRVEEYCVLRDFFQSLK